MTTVGPPFVLHTSKHTLEEHELLTIICIKPRVTPMPTEHSTKWYEQMTMSTWTGVSRPHQDMAQPSSRDRFHHHHKNLGGPCRQASFHQLPLREALAPTCALLYLHACPPASFCTIRARLNFHVRALLASILGLLSLIEDRASRLSSLHKAHQRSGGGRVMNIDDPSVIAP